MHFNKVVCWWNKTAKPSVYLIDRPYRSLHCNLQSFNQLEFFMLKTLSLTACAAAMLFIASAASAAPTDDAKNHFQAIGSGDLSIVMRGYADNAQFNWVGGPLDGTYASLADTVEPLGLTDSSSLSTLTFSGPCDLVNFSQTPRMASDDA